jgi:phage tail-like protein
VASMSGAAPTSRDPSQGSAGAYDGVGELRFLVTVGGASGEIGRFSECTGLAVEYEVMEYREGGNNDFVHKLRGPAKYPPLVLKRGITKEDALTKWFKNCSTKADRMAVTVSLLGPKGVSSKVRTWSFVGAYPVKWTGPNLNAGSNNLATETLEIVHEGFSVAAGG